MDTIGTLATQLARGLEADVERRLGEIVREPDPGDRGALTATLTPEGERLLKAIERSERDAEIALAQAVGPDRHLAVRTALRDLIRAAG